jgi:hypothetical protein
LKRGKLILKADNFTLRPFYFTYFVASLFACSICNQTFAQPKEQQELRHTISTAGGFGSSKYFSGPSFGFSYAYGYKNNRLQLSAAGLLELKVLGGKERTLGEYAISYHRIIPIKNIHFSLGSGLAYNIHALNVNDVYSAPDDEIIKLKNWGVPLFATITFPTRRVFSFGLQVHTNFNDVNPWSDAKLIFSFSL